MNTPIKNRLTETQKLQQAKILAGWVQGRMRMTGCDVQAATEFVIGDHEVDAEFWASYVEPLLPSGDDTPEETMAKLKRRMEMEKE